MNPTTGTGAGADAGVLSSVTDPFAVLGLPPDPDLTDEEVHHAWRSRLAAAHPDRGGSPEQATHISIAYQALRSGVRRAEALEALPPPAVVANPRDGAPASRGDGPARGDRGTARMPQPRQPEERINVLVPTPERRAELRRIVAKQRTAQGLPEFIEDEAILDKIVDILLYSQEPTKRRRTGEQRAAPPDRRTAQEPRVGAAPDRPDSEQRDNAAPARDSRGEIPWTPTVGLRRRLGALAERVQYGRPLWLVLRVLIASAVPVVAYVIDPAYPAWIALAVGAITWLTFTARYDLAPPRGRLGWRRT